MPIAEFTLVALDCRDPMSLAEFYREIIGGHIKFDAASPDWVRLETGSGCDIGFQLDPTHEPPGWPNGAQQLHLDFDVSDLESAESEAIAIGAQKAAVQPSPNEWRVYIDPAGHPFCFVKR
jgi:hypothetical protein